MAADGPRGSQPACTAGHDHDVSAQERIMNIPGSEVTGMRGGIITRSPAFVRNQRI